MISERVAYCVVSQSVGELIRLRVGDDSPYVFTVRDFEPLTDCVRYCISEIAVKVPFQSSDEAGTCSLQSSAYLLIGSTWCRQRDRRPEPGEASFCDGIPLIERLLNRSSRRAFKLT